MKNQRPIFILLILTFTLFGFTVVAGEHILQPKLGFVDWSDNDNHRIKGNGFNLDSNSEFSGGFMYLYRLDNGFSFGAEHFSYVKDYTHTNGKTGEVDLTQAFLLAEYYFNNKGLTKPFIGFGLGWAWSDFDGPIEQKAYGPASQFKAGVEFVVNKRFSFSVEGKYFTLDIDEEINGESADVKSDGTAIFVGFSIKI